MFSRSHPEIHPADGRPRPADAFPVGIDVRVLPGLLGQMRRDPAISAPDFENSFSSSIGKSLHHPNFHTIFVQLHVASS